MYTQQIKYVYAQLSQGLWKNYGHLGLLQSSIPQARLPRVKLPSWSSCLCVFKDSTASDN